MKLSEAATYLRSVITYNVSEFAKGSSHSAYIVPFFVSDPGVGKTTFIRHVSKGMDLEYYQSIVAQYDPGELGGLPYVDKSGENMIRLRPSYLPPLDRAGEGGVFNLDELPQAMLASQNICSQIVNEWRVGDHRIDRSITIVATGNKPSNKAGTTSMPTHLRDRLCFITIETDHNDFLTYAASVGMDPRVRAYIKERPAALHKFDAAANSCPSPRSWEKVSATLSLEGLSKSVRREAIAGYIGEGDATSFEAWLRVEGKLPKFEDILADPKNVPIFTNKDADVLYLLMSSLADNLNERTADPISQYVLRTPNKEFIAYWVSEVKARDPKILGNKFVRSVLFNAGVALM